MKKKSQISKPLLVFLLITLASCAGSEGVVSSGETEGEPSLESTSTPAGPTLEPSKTPLPLPTSTPTATPVVVLDRDPIQIDFQTEDGVSLKGNYYPAARLMVLESSLTAH